MSRQFRAFVEGPVEEVGEEILLSKGEGKRLAQVLRLQVGEKVELLDGKGGRFYSECIKVSKDEFWTRVLKAERMPSPAVPIRMVVALGKGSKWEELIRPMTELGASRICPMISKRTEGRVPDSKLQEKKRRWDKIAREACKQSGNSWLPDFDDPIDFSSLLLELQSDEECWMASLRQRNSPFSPAVASGMITVLIGPEGGWAPEEEKAAEDSGVRLFGLGGLTLRMETAAVCALAIARHHLLC